MNAKKCLGKSRTEGLNDQRPRRPQANKGKAPDKKNGGKTVNVTIWGQGPWQKGPN